MLRKHTLKKAFDRKLKESNGKRLSALHETCWHIKGGVFVFQVACPWVGFPAVAWHNRCQWGGLLLIVLKGVLKVKWLLRKTWGTPTWWPTAWVGQSSLTNRPIRRQRMSSKDQNWIFQPSLTSMPKGSSLVEWVGCPPNSIPIIYNGVFSPHHGTVFHHWWFPFVNQWPGSSNSLACF